MFVFYESRKRKLKIRIMNGGRCDERLKLELRNLHASHTLGCTTKKLAIPNDEEEVNTVYLQLNKKKAKTMLIVFFFNCNWNKKRRKPRGYYVTLKL